MHVSCKQEEQENTFDIHVRGVGKEKEKRKIMKNLLSGFIGKKNFWPRLLISFLAVIGMGVTLSLLIQVNLGTDPCTLMNRAISAKIHMSLGNWQALLNLALFIIVMIFGARNFGFGSLFNMFLVGYTIDFCTWLWNKILPMEMFQLWSVRIGVLIPVMALFVISVAFYMDVDMGTAPYDAIPYLISARLPKVPFRTIRICFDLTVTLIGWALGETPGIVTVMMVVLLGPVISWMGEFLAKHFEMFRDL